MFLRKVENSVRLATPGPILKCPPANKEQRAHGTIVAASNDILERALVTQSSHVTKVSISR
jgi:hypothetical protein